MNMESLAEEFRNAFINFGAAGLDQGYHSSWRCQYPDSYGHGECHCLSEFIDELIEITNKWYSEHE